MVDSGNTYGERVSRLVGWGHWFAFFNIIAAMLIGTRYIVHSPWPETLLGQFYLAVSWIGHFSFLIFALYLLILFPLTFLIPSRKLFRLVAVCFSTVGLTLLLIDTQAYQIINLHLNRVVWEVLFSDSNSAISTDLQHLFIVMPLIFLLELGLSEWVWRKQRKLSHKRVGRPIAALLFVCFITSHLIYVWSDAYFYNSVTSQKSNFPLSYPMTAKSFMEKHGLLDRADYLKRKSENEGKLHLVDYPLEPLKFDRRANHLNVLVISVDNLRADAVTAENMPNAYQYAQNNLDFTNHYSSSNDMYGMFGLFYGLPSSYASSIKAQGSSPVMIKAMEDQGYSFGLFSGDNFEDDLFADTIFHGLKLNKVDFNDQSSPDSQAINKWSDWVKAAKTPWFSFIELTTVENFSNYSGENKLSYPKLLQSYDKSAHVADSELGQLLEQIKSLGLSKDTVVVITSNHGMELNDTNTNSWGSNSNYSRYQLQVPMIIHWPGMLPAKFTHRSSHLDFSVTILQEILGVSSNPFYYSSGRSLFNESKRKWVLAGDAKELALITPDRTAVIDRFGNYKLYDKNYKRLDDNPRLPVLMQGLTELQRFYTKNN